jgi:hypothetical protein
MRKETRKAIEVLAKAKWSASEIAKAFGGVLTEADVKAVLVPKPRPKGEAAAVQEAQRRLKQAPKRTIP